MTKKDNHQQIDSPPNKVWQICLSFGLTIGISVYILGFLLGAWLDDKLGTGPLFTIIGALIAKMCIRDRVIGAFIGLARGETMADFQLCCGFFLFGFTYLILAATLNFNLDIRVYGWYAGLVAIFALVFGINCIVLGDIGTAYLWLASVSYTHLGSHSGKTNTPKAQFR